MKKLMIALIALVVITGCNDTKSNKDTYKSSEVGRVNTIARGEIIEVNAVEIKGDRVIGTSTGLVIGAVAGAFMGGTDTVHVIMGTVGAVAGAYAGNKISGKMNDGKGYEYIIRLDDDSLVHIVQGRENRLSFGDRVIIRFDEKDTIIEKDYK